MFQFKSSQSSRPPTHTHINLGGTGASCTSFPFFFPPFFFPHLLHIHNCLSTSLSVAPCISLFCSENTCKQLTGELVLLFQERHCSALAEPKSRGNLLTARAGVFAVSGQILGSACIFGFNKLLYFNAKRINLNSHSRQPVLSQNIVFKPRQHPVYIDKQIHSPQSFFQLEQLLST